MRRRGRSPTRGSCRRSQPSCRDLRIDPSRLTIEITETAIIVDVASVNDTLRRIKRLGCRIALDDFGSGFTSFLHLKQLPIDDIKIDGSFVRIGGGQPE